MLQIADCHVVEHDSRIAAPDEPRARRFAAFVHALSGQGGLEEWAEVRRLRSLIGECTPIVVILPPGFAVEALNQAPDGFVDFIEQPVNRLLLCAKIKTFMDMASKMAKLQAAQARERMQAAEDANVSLRAFLADLGE